ncbi:unnamed protein product [Lactuca saligna]|uniref:RRM domain-containing protein n=1 Tax=Lactuca saligna TaxID=75948 RepID=A0AA35YGA7_LACSI|nr:unnamed protein product [Lactuca saligna]
MERWTQVRRKKTPANHRFRSDETSFFVSNIPTGATKDEFRRIFNAFGKLTDIYFGGRKGKNGKNFGFIRYSGVEDKRMLEAKLNGTICRSCMLEINIARHERAPPETINRKTHPPTHAKTKVGGGFVGNRSYAEVAGGNVGTEIPLNQAPIQLHVDDRVMRLATGNCLIGEVKTLDHLGHLLALMSIFSNVGVKVKYAGGMKAIIAFDSESLATSFLNIEENWKGIFNYLKPVGEVDYDFERVASIQIVGLPIRLWCEENFSTIVRRFDNEVQPCEPETDYVTSEEDLDDEVDDVSGNDEDGISDTWMGDIEEGEIVIEESVDGAENSGCSDDHRTMKISPVQESPVASVSQQSHACPSAEEAETSHGKKKEVSIVDDLKETRDSKINEPGQVAGNGNESSGPIVEHSVLGLHKPIPFPSNLAQSGCFGPFPSKAINSPSDTQVIQIRENGMGRSAKKRCRSCSKSPSVEFSGLPVQNLFNEDDDQTPSVGHQCLSRDQPISPTAYGPKNVPKISEIEATAEIGAMIGFEIDAANKLLAEILGGNGELHVPQ